MPFILTLGIYESLCEFTEKGLALPKGGKNEQGKEGEKAVHFLALAKTASPISTRGKTG